MRLVLPFLRNSATFLDLSFISDVRSRESTCVPRKSIPKVVKCRTELEGKCRGYCEKNVMKMFRKSDVVKYPGRLKGSPLFEMKT